MRANNPEGDTVNGPALQELIRAAINHNKGEKS
jgi:hypothetical protein